MMQHSTNIVTRYDVHTVHFKTKLDMSRIPYRRSELNHAKLDLLDFNQFTRATGEREIYVTHVGYILYSEKRTPQNSQSAVTSWSSSDELEIL